LNIPVQSVDSASGIITSDWIRRGSNSGMGSLLGGLMGDNSHAPTRHRFIVRVFRMKAVDHPGSKLEIRVLGQMYLNKHWVNKPFKRKISLELFAAVEKQLGRVQPQQAPVEDNRAK